MVRISLLRRWLTVAAIATAVAGPALALGPHRPRIKRDVRAEVEAVDQQWRKAELANDTSTMDKLLADDYLGVTAGGRMVTKEQQLDRMRSRQTDITRLDFSDVKVRLLDQAAAIVTSTAELQGTIDGHPVHGRFRSIRVYHRVAPEVWKLISFEATQMRPDGSMPGSGEGNGR